MLLCALSRNSGLSCSTSFFLIFLAFFWGGASVNGQATINSPASVTECLPQQLTVSGGTPPYTIDVLPGGATGGQPLETIQVASAGSVRWLVDLPAGQNITFAVRDDSGSVNYSAQVPILAGTSTDCLRSGSETASGSTTTAIAEATSAADAVTTA
ncbi:hypothetical protein JCM8547_008068 [Rhodosporidiobolus lusitaniae]